MSGIKVGKSMMMFNIQFEHQMKALKKGKSIIIDMEMSEIETMVKNRDLSNNGLVLIDHVGLIK